MSRNLKQNILLATEIKNENEVIIDGQYIGQLNGMKLNLDLKVIVLNNMSENTPLDNYSEISNYTDIPVVKLKYNQELTKEILKYIK